LYFRAHAVRKDDITLRLYAERRGDGEARSRGITHDQTLQLQLPASRRLDLEPSALESSASGGSIMISLITISPSTGVSSDSMIVTKPTTSALLSSHDPVTVAVSSGSTMASTV
jgi:hypothetical protein